MRVWTGKPHPLGATWDGAGTNFALFSAHAERVELCLFDTPQAERETERITLPEYTDEVWHGYFPDIQPDQIYGFRVYGPHAPSQGHRFNPNKLVLDPYAKALARNVLWDDAVFSYSIGGDALSYDERDSARFAPLAMVVDRAFTWSDDRRPNTPWNKTVIYELHVKGFTVRQPGIPEQRRGTYLRVCSEAAIEHLLSLGVTAVELLPVHAHVDGFRFDLASTLARELYEVNKLSAFFEIIHQDPVLAQGKLIAEPWDVGPGGYQVGNFPIGWTEWNGKYRDCVRRFWKGDEQTTAILFERLLIARQWPGSNECLEEEIGGISIGDGRPIEVAGRGLDYALETTEELPKWTRNLGEDVQAHTSIFAALRVMGSRRGERKWRERVSSMPRAVATIRRVVRIRSSPSLSPIRFSSKSAGTECSASSKTVSSRRWAYALCRASIRTTRQPTRRPPGARCSIPSGNGLGLAHRAVHRRLATRPSG